MKIGVVSGAVWSTKKCDSLTGHPLLLVNVEETTLVADDLVGAGTGDRVLVSFGSAARTECPQAPVDAAIVGIIDPMEETDVNQ